MAVNAVEDESCLKDSKTIRYRIISQPIAVEGKTVDVYGICITEVDGDAEDSREYPNISDDRRKVAALLNEMESGMVDHTTAMDIILDAVNH